jgi:O-methyltransferase
MSVMNQNILNLLRRIRRPRHYAIYDLFRKHTMLRGPKYVANLELASQVESVAGAIVECGTWRGGMIAGLAVHLGTAREYWLFDSFEGLPPVETIDGKSAKEWQDNKQSPFYYNNCTASEEEASTAMKLSGAVNVKLIKGWFQDTLPTVSFPGGIALLRLDADWYKSTYQILQWLFPLVNPNGLIVVDDYYIWDGCSKAVHDYLSEHKRSERIASHENVCFMIKREEEPEAGV